MGGRSRNAPAPLAGRGPRLHGPSRRVVRLIVCGERQRGDDAVAFLAVDGLPKSVLDLVELTAAGMLDPDLLTSLPSNAAVVIVDAAVGVEPGSIVTLPLDAIAAGGGPAPHSSHALPIDQILGLVHVLRDGLPEGLFVGLGAASFEIGAPLSPAVAAALPDFTDAVAAEVRRLSGP